MKIEVQRLLKQAERDLQNTQKNQSIAEFVRKSKEIGIVQESLRDRIDLLS